MVESIDATQASAAADAPQGQRKRATAPGPIVLELRIHGVLNSPPEGMLGLPRDKITSAGNDDLGGFWRPLTPSEETPRTPGTPEPAAGADPVIVTEAYSWGAMARSGGGALAAIGAFFIQLGWLFVVPFGLCNAAYWTRRIGQDAPARQKDDPTPRQQKRATARQKKDDERAWFGGPGAAVTRVFALALTLLFVAAFSTVTLDFIGTQCFRGAITCANMPPGFELLPANARSVRLLALSLLPIAAILLIYVITRRARVRYEAGVRVWATGLSSDTTTVVRTSSDGGPSKTVLPHLATEAFWSRARIGPTTERLHIAGSIALVVLLLAWDARFHPYEECYTPGGVFSSCLAPSGPYETSLSVIIAVTLLLLARVVWLTFYTSEVPKEKSAASKLRTQAGRALVVACVLFVTHAAIVLWGYWQDVDAAKAVDPSEVEPFLGVSVATNVLVGFLLVGCFSSLAWRRRVPVVLATLLPLTALVLLALGGLLAEKQAAEGAPLPVVSWVLFVIAGLALLVAVSLALFPPRRWKSGEEDVYVAWRGYGPAVALTLSVFAALFITTSLVLGVRTALLPALATTEVDGAWRVPAEPDGESVTATLDIEVPPVYDLFGIAVIAAVFAAVVFALVVVIAWARNGYTRFTTPRLAVVKGAAPAAHDDGKWADPSYPLESYGSKGPQKVSFDEQDDQRSRQVASARRFAALAHRGEPIIGLLAFVALGLLTAVVVINIALGEEGVTKWFTPEVAAWISRISLTVIGGVAIAVVGLVAVNAMSKKERPIGLLWDLMCFLPRAGHPFAPPCYGERVVPELTSRATDWLEGRQHDADEPPALPGEAARRKIVFSAHSLGAVLATAAIFALDQDKEVAYFRDSRVGLLTYGVQLRAYFSRFFPDVLGHDVLGVVPARGPRPLRADPWELQVEIDQSNGKPSPNPRFSPSLRSVLSRGGKHPAWVNLWRRTDYLGFPVNSYSDRNPLVDPTRAEPGPDSAPTNLIDVGASESDPRSYLWAVASHPDYQFSREYEVALAEVIDRLD